MVKEEHHKTYTVIFNALLIFETFQNIGCLSFERMILISVEFMRYRTGYEPDTPVWMFLFSILSTQTPGSSAPSPVGAGTEESSHRCKVISTPSAEVCSNE
jgi:hypothetical protein